MFRIIIMVVFTLMIAGGCGNNEIRIGSDQYMIVHTGQNSASIIIGPAKVDTTGRKVEVLGRHLENKQLFTFVTPTEERAVPVVISVEVTDPNAAAPFGKPSPIQTASYYIERTWQKECDGLTYEQFSALKESIRERTLAKNDSLFTKWGIVADLKYGS